MATHKRSLLLTTSLVVILSILFLGGARIASAAFQTSDSGMPFVSAVFHTSDTTSETTIDANRSSEAEFSGAVQVTGTDHWTIGGLVVLIQPGTEFKGSFSVGDQVKVHVYRDAIGQMIAREISPLVAGSVDLSNGNASFDNENESMGEDNGNSNESISEDNDNANEENDNESITNGNANDDHDHENGNENGNANDDDHGEHSEKGQKHG
jgi:cobalamin biosynthesis protein CobT